MYTIKSDGKITKVYYNDIELQGIKDIKVYADYTGVTAEITIYSPLINITNAEIRHVEYV